jgi:hypothetical protein
MTEAERYEQVKKGMDQQIKDAEKEAQQGWIISTIIGFALWYAYKKLK